LTNLKTIIKSLTYWRSLLTITLSKIGVIGVPYNTGSKGLNLAKGSEALRNAGIVNALQQLSEVVDFGDINVNLPPPDRSNPKLLSPNQAEVLCKALAAKVKATIDTGCFPFIVGGDCSMLMGIIEGLRSLNAELGMVYMDAHGDFNTPETTPSGIIGGMDVAIVAGRGPEKLTDMFGHSPLLPVENIVLYGVRDLDPLEAEALAESQVRVYRREKIRTQGAENVAKEILRYLEPKCRHLYLHVDLDVLDESVCSAQGLPVPDGVSKAEFLSTFKALAKSGKLCSVTLTAFDAAKDLDGSQARKIVGLVSEALRDS
jgi:arginase